MAVPMTPTQITNQLDRWGIRWLGHSSWQTHNRGNRGNGFSNVNGLMLHHTGSDAPDQRPFLHNGSKDLPGPLCHFGIDQIGRVHIIGWGRTNHAGGGDPNVHKHVINEDYTGILKPKYHEGSSGAVDGNGHFYGAEIWYSGSHEMTDAQYFTVNRLAAAIAEFHKWSELSVIGHGEWSSWKWDPGYTSNKMMNMENVRGDIKATIKRGPVASSSPTNDSVDPKTSVYKQVWDNDSTTPPKGHASTANPSWTPMSVLKGAFENAEQARINTEKIMKHLGI